MNKIGTIELQDDVMWINKEDPIFAENVGHTLGYGVVIQRYPIGTKELKIGTVDEDKGTPQGYFTYVQFKALQTYARNNTVVVFDYEGETVSVVILESSLVNLKPLIKRPNPATADWYMGYFTAIES